MVWGVVSECKFWPKCYHYNCCFLRTISLHMTAIYRWSIVSYCVVIGNPCHTHCFRIVAYTQATCVGPFQYKDTTLAVKGTHNKSRRSGNRLIFIIWSYIRRSCDCLILTMGIRIPGRNIYIDICSLPVYFPVTSNVSCFVVINTLPPEQILQTIFQVHFAERKSF